MENDEITLPESYVYVNIANDGDGTSFRCNLSSSQEWHDWLKKFESSACQKFIVKRTRKIVFRLSAVINQQAIVKMFSIAKGISNDMYMGADISTGAYIPTKPNEGLAKIEQKQESGKTFLVIDSGAPLSNATVEKVKKVISSTKQKAVGEEASKQEQLEEFLRKCKTFTDVPVKDMRHIIPLFLMEVYVEKYGHYTRKVKGLWEKRPDDWPENVPFVDPNNKLKDADEKKNVKPKKELLGQMLTYLAGRYTMMKSAVPSDRYFQHENDPMLPFPNQSMLQYDDLYPFDLNLVETNESELRAAEQSVSDQSLSTGHNSSYSSLPGYSFALRQNAHSSLSSMTNDGSMIQSSLSTLGDPFSGGVEELGMLEEDGAGGWPRQIQPDLEARPPEQVVDNEEETSSVKDWYPLEEICERTRLKLGYMKTKMNVSPVMYDQLKRIHGFLKNSFVSVLDDDAKLKLLEKWYHLEKCIDSVKFQQLCNCPKMIQDLYDELYSKMVLPMKYVDNNTAKSMSMDLTNLAEDQEQFSSQSDMNIRLRPGPAGDMVQLSQINQLEMRPFVGMPSGSSNICGVSSLSDNNKPIQLAQEDEEVLKPGKPEDNHNIVTDELPLLSEDDIAELWLQLDGPELLSVPVQESAPATQPTSQLAGKFEMPMDPLHHVMTGVSVQQWVGECPAMFTFPSPAVASPQLASNPLLDRPSTAFAEECIKRLSISVNPSPPMMQRANPCPPVQPLLDQLLSKRASGRPGGKRCYVSEEDDEPGNIVSGPSKPAKAPAYNTMIPLVVEEISNNLDKPVPRLMKRKTR